MFRRNKGSNGMPGGQGNQPKYLATTIEVTCPACHETYNIRTNQHLYTRNCRCSRGTFEVQLGTGYGHVSVFFIDGVGTRSQFSNWRIVAQ